MYEFDTYYPDHLGMDPNDRESWKIYADSCRNIMTKCLDKYHGCLAVDCDIIDSTEYS